MFEQVNHEMKKKENFTYLGSGIGGPWLVEFVRFSRRRIMESSKTSLWLLELTGGIVVVS